MNYVSTRGNSRPCRSAEAIRRGLAEDGGLYFPDEIPSLTAYDLAELCGDDYPTRAAKIMELFLSDSFSYEELLDECRAAYREESFPGGPAPIARLGRELRVLELWHGPTAAFKDMALQIMPRLFVRSVAKTGDNRRALILVATSGDTGKAALEGYRDVKNVGIEVFYPVNGVSRVQKLQMATQEGNNVEVHAVVGNFDDAQNGVKAIFHDEKTAAKLHAKGVFLSSANSINWGRLVPQVAYYVSAYCDLVKAGDIEMGEPIRVCVPTGNFGNILAGYIARTMGVPIEKLICASNRNRVLTDFFETGTYDRNRAFHLTSSPSMDILISSNLERLLFLMAGPEETARYMEELNRTGRYTVSPEIRAELSAAFEAGCCEEDGTENEIRHVFETYGYLCDTHTAVGLSVAETVVKNGYGGKLLSLSTASPYKFAPSVLRALTGEAPENELDAMDRLREITGVPIPAPLSGIGNRKIRFDPEKAIKADDMPEAVLSFQRF